MSPQEGRQNSKPAGPKRTADLHVGIAQEQLHTVQKEIPADEPPPLALNVDLSVIGKPTKRWNGKAKVTGSGHYTADIRLPGMLLRSRTQHVRVPEQMDPGI